MHIININDKKIAGCLCAFLLVFLACGCAQKDDLEEARGYAHGSDAYYQRAVGIYKELLAKGKDIDRLHFELGELYYKSGRWKEAAGELRESAGEKAKKLLAISYYRLGNFAEALEIFNKDEAPDDESLYYQGLTCEKLNLFGQAIAAYKKIEGKEFFPAASERLDMIEKGSGHLQIKDINQQVHSILQSAPGQDKYPQAGALILLCDEEIETTPQDNQVYTLHYLVKILNERGKEDFSETRINYDSTYETVELEYARTIKPDGTVTEVGTRHIRDVSKYLNFPLYSNARVYIISFPEITEGAAIEYKVRIRRNQLINKNDFVVSYPVQAGDPVIFANMRIILPSPESLMYIKSLNEEYNYFGAELKPFIQKGENGDERLVCSWQFRDIPQIIPESNMPESVEINPTILTSTFSSWQEVYDWWSSLAFDKIKADPAIKEKVRELAAGKKSDEDKISAIYNFCAKDIRYVAVEYGQAGYEPHPAADIFRNKYGDCKDQAILLVAMLREAGFSAWPVLIPTKGVYDLNKDFPSVFFNHCIAAIAVKDGIVFADPTAETCSFGDLPAADQGRNVLVFREKDYEILQTPLYTGGHNLIRQFLKIKISPDETISAQKSVSSFGVYDQGQRYWMLYTPPELIRETLKEKIQSVSIGAALEDYNIENLNDLNTPVVLSYSFKGSEYFTEAGKSRIMPQLSSLDTSLVAKDKRRYPVAFPFLDTRETSFEIELPRGLSVKYMPQSVSEETPWLDFKVEYKQKNNKIYFTETARLKKILIPLDEYFRFKGFFEGLAKRIKQRIILEKR
ncbi:MAG: DUF3857 domain-containing protein [Candidatus Omnitrophota bacterium]|jgi:tetratricopeptide (TPR) repeat protein